MARNTHFACQRKQIKQILERLHSIKKLRTKTPIKILEKLSGSLQQEYLGIPGGAGLFSPPQVALAVTSQWLRITPNLTQCLSNWGLIVKHMGKHPTQVRHLVNKFPNFIGYSDSFGIITGGVWTSGINKIGSIICQEECPQKVKEIFKVGILIVNNLGLVELVLNYLAV